MRLNSDGRDITPVPKIVLPDTDSTGGKVAVLSNVGCL
jgi:hypothetical protein